MIKISGASDDLIEIEGDIREEFNWYSDDGEQRLLAISDGTLLRVEYDRDGIWRFTKIIGGLAKFEKIEGSVEEDTPDQIILSEHDIKWVVFGEAAAYCKKENRQ